MKLIIEGVNFAGKSTLIDYIKKEEASNFRLYTTVHFKAPDVFDPNPMDTQRELYYHYTETVLNEEKYVMFDRFHLGESIYSPIYRKYAPQYMEDLESRMSDSVILVLITAKTETLQKRFDAKKISAVKFSNLELIRNSFEGAFKHSKIKHKIRVETDNLTPAKIFEAIKFENYRIHHYNDNISKDTYLELK